MIFFWLALFCAAGFAFGALYFHALRKNAELYLERDRRGVAVLLHIVRILVAAGLFVAASLAGAGPLLTAFAGFLVARFALVRPR